MAFGNVGNDAFGSAPGFEAGDNAFGDLDSSPFGSDPFSFPESNNASGGRTDNKSKGFDSDFKF